MQVSKLFTPMKLTGFNINSNELTLSHCSEDIIRHKYDFESFLQGQKILWGIPFDLGSNSNGGNNLVYLNSGEAEVSFGQTSARWLVFVHTAETPLPVAESDGLYRNFRGVPPVSQTICEYIINYADGDKISVPIRSRMEINDMIFPWGNSAFLSEASKRSYAVPTITDDLSAGRRPINWSWGGSQPRLLGASSDGSLQKWLYAWENPSPDKAISSITVKHHSGRLFLMGVTAGNVSEHPLRYGRRRKFAFSVTSDNIENINPLDLADIDLGHIISVVPRPFYNNQDWEKGYNNQMPEYRKGEYILEFNSHDDAVLYIGLGDNKTPVNLGKLSDIENILNVLPAEQPVKLIVQGPDGLPVPVKVHAHGVAGEYLPPRHRHRIPNPHWFEDYSVDFVHGQHWCTYIDGTAEYLLPQGEVFFEVSKGFEIVPVRRRFNITPDTSEIIIKLEHVLDWRSKGWVTADTHVHFLSPDSALLEGEAEGVNVVNLLASQWGELFTNIGDFNGNRETASDRDYLVRVGTENRQHILGHISLLGYEGSMILPLTTGGPDESALGDPIETTLTEWAKHSRLQNGLNILPHFPNPRAEGAAAIVSELIDGVEMTSWGDLYGGISPYSLSDWYRYLSCGYHVAAVGGTDKMSADTAVGTVRTYAKINTNEPFSYQAWKNAVKAGNTFATYGALVDMRVEGKEPGGKIELKGNAELTVEWTIASVTIPITAIELVVGGETVDTVRFDVLTGSKSGYFKVKIDKSSWAALRVRGHHADKPEIITAHTSAVMIYIDGKPPINAADAVTILEQIEGVTAYVKTLGTKAQEKQYKQVLMALTSAHRLLHNRMHQLNYYHDHTPIDNHDGH